MKKRIVLAIFISLMQIASATAQSPKLPSVRMEYTGVLIGLAAEPGAKLAQVIASLNATATSLSQKHATQISCFNEINNTVVSGSNVAIYGALNCTPSSPSQVLQAVMGRWIGEDLTEAAGAELTTPEGAVSGHN
jgi:hypothetical protein